MFDDILDVSIIGEEYTWLISVLIIISLIIEENNILVVLNVVVGNKVS